MKTYQLPKTSAAHNLISTTNLPTTGLLRLPQVLAAFPVSRSAWYAGISSGIYPRPIKLGERSTAWSAESIRELINRVSDSGRLA